MSRIKVIGVGSAQGRDQAGWRVIEKLQQAGFDKLFPPGTVELSNCRFPAQLIQMLEGCERAIIIDAVEQTPGRVFEYSSSDLLLSQHLHSTHGIGVGEALALAERLLPVAVPVKVIGVGVGRPVDQAALDNDELMAIIQSSLEEEIRPVV